MEAAVHMVMGTEEAQVITTALGFFAARLGDDIEVAPDTCEEDRKNLMTMLSLQLSAAAMHENLMDLLTGESEEFEDD